MCVKILPHVEKNYHILENCDTCGRNLRHEWKTLERGKSFITYVKFAIRVEGILTCVVKKILHMS